MPTLFFGLGPAGDVTDELLKAKCEEVAPVTEVRMRGRSAFVDVEDDETAQKMVAALNNEHINSSRLSVQVSHASAGTVPAPRAERGGGGGGGGGRRNGDGIFIGLGPRGDITEDDLKARIEQVAPIKALRMRGQCAFLDCETEEDARKVIESLDQQTINTSRLSVQYSRMNQDRERGGRGGRGGFDDRKRYRSPSRDRRRYRSDSRDHRRRYRSDSRDRRRHRDDSRDRRRRDRSDSRDHRRRQRDDSAGGRSASGRDERREQRQRSPSATKSSRSHS